MPAFIHINLRVIDPARQANLAPRFRLALEEAGGKILHFGPVVEVLEGDEEPLPFAGIFEFLHCSRRWRFTIRKNMPRLKLNASWHSRQKCSLSPLTKRFVSLPAVSFPDFSTRSPEPV